MRSARRANASFGPSEWCRVPSRRTLHLGKTVHAAHPREFVRSPDWDEFLRLQQISGGRIRLVTLAPELPGAIDFISRAVTSGVVVSIGHTAATRSKLPRLSMREPV